MFCRRLIAQRTAGMLGVSSALRFQSRRGGAGGSDDRVRQAQMEVQARAQQQLRAEAQSRGRQQPPPRQQQQQEEEPQEDEEDATPPPPPTKPETSKYVKVDQRPDGVALLKMSRAPVNSLNLDMFQELIDWMMWLSTEESGAKSVVLTSELNTVFSAGLDINELHKPDPERFQEFWYSFQEIWMILNTFPKPVIAGINGNSPAGGCVLALACDYRVMARASMKDPANPKAYRIGLNETKLGIVAPPWVMRSLSYAIGERKAERMLQLGETPTAEEALTIGLVDRVVEENEIVDAAVHEALRFSAIPAEARWLTKDLSRQALTGFFSTPDARKYDGEFFANMIQNPEVVDNIGKYLARLGGKK